MKKNKKVRAALITSLIVLTVAGLIWGAWSYYSLYRDFTFSEGTLYEDEAGGGLITVALNWKYFRDDSFLMDNEKTGEPLQEIFCDLHKSSLVDSFKGSLCKVKYTKQITVIYNNTEKTYYLVGDYYITAK